MDHCNDKYWCSITSDSACPLKEFNASDVMSFLESFPNVKIHPEQSVSASVVAIGLDNWVGSNPLRSVSPCVLEILSLMQTQSDMKLYMPEQLALSSIQEHAIRRRDWDALQYTLEIKFMPYSFKNDMLVREKLFRKLMFALHWYAPTDRRKSLIDLADATGLSLELLKDEPWNSMITGGVEKFKEFVMEAQRTPDTRSDDLQVLLNADFDYGKAVWFLGNPSEYMQEFGEMALVKPLGFLSLPCFEMEISENVLNVLADMSDKELVRAITVVLLKRFDSRLSADHLSRLLKLILSITKDRSILILLTIEEESVFRKNFEHATEEQKQISQQLVEKLFVLNPEKITRTLSSQ